MTQGLRHLAMPFARRALSGRVKFGKKPARPSAIPLEFSSYFDLSNLPTPPAIFGNFTCVSNYGMDGNDQYGDCVEAGAAHETQYWPAACGNPIPTFSDATVLENYTEATGFDPCDPNSDQGTDMGEFAAYRKTRGIIDDSGKRHFVDAYVGIKPGNIQELAFCAWAFGAVGFGFEVPESAMTQFDAGQPFTVSKRHSSILGGHYVPVIGRRSNGNFVFISWGELYLPGMTPQFIQRYNDESICWLDLEWVNNLSQVAPTGVNLAQLRADLNLLPLGPI